MSGSTVLRRCPIGRIEKDRARLSVEFQLEGLLSMITAVAYVPMFLDTFLELKSVLSLLIPIVYILSELKI